MPSIPNIKTIEAIIVPAEFISPKKVASKSAVCIYLATSINHFPNSSPIRYTFISAKIQLFSVISSVGCISFPQLAAFRFLSWL